MDFIAYLTEINATVTVEQAFDVLERYIALLGFDRVVYSLITDHPRLLKKRGHGILRNYPDDWMSYYNSKNYIETDPVIATIKQQSGAFLWRDLPQLRGNLRKNEKLLMDEARDAKLHDGIGIGLHEAGGSIIGMGVASSGTFDSSPATLSLVYALCVQFHTVYLQRETRTMHGMIRLSPREKDILQYVAEGKTRSEIGQILTISDNTIKIHVRRIFIKLGVNQTNYAIVKAISYGLISPNISHNFLQSRR